jgi:predicted O-methyltransferase YrrM
MSGLRSNARRVARYLRRIVTGQQPKPPTDFQVPQALEIPAVDGTGLEARDLIRAIVKSPEHQQAAATFAGHPFWADRIISEFSTSLIYALVRNLKPEVCVEIGSFHGKTAYAITHALDRNGGTGMIHTVGPFDSDEFLPRYRQWPASMRERVAYYPVTSADFFMQNEHARRRFDLSFVDGNHDYEFAFFDIQCAARRTNPGGIIIVDNVSQAGPIFAVIDFLAANPDWREIGINPMPKAPTVAFEPGRASVDWTDFLILQAPDRHKVGGRPTTSGEILWSRNSVSGVMVEIDGTGEVVCQCILRGFGRNGQSETVAQGRGAGEIRFAAPAVAPENDYYRAEIWVTSLSGDLTLKSVPRPI